MFQSSLPYAGSAAGVLEPTTRAHRPPPLPADLTATSFVGHEELLSTLVDRVRTGADRLITLTGPGGIGKSRLAQELTRRLAPDFGDHVAWLPLAPIHHPDLVVVAFAEAFGLEGAFGPNPTLDRAIAWLGEAPALLILDNAEHLPGIGRGIECVLRHCPRVVVVITSRIALGLEGERVVVVPPLDIGPAGGDLFTSPAVRLFEERARRAAPGFGLTLENVDDVARVCALLGGMPLAIELAASRTALYSPADLLAIDHHIVSAIDDGAQADGQARHKLSSTVNWAFERLSPIARQAATWLALAPGGFTLDTALAICRATPTTISELLDHHLIRAMDDATGHRRFGMHELIRQAAIDLLDGSGQRLAERQFRTAMLDVATAFLALPHDVHFSANLASLITEAPNLRLALSMALDDGDMVAASVLLEALEHYWIRRSRFDELGYWLDRIRAVDMHGLSGRQPREFATFYRSAASMLIVQGQLAAAVPLAEQSVRLARTTRDHVLLARCLLAQSWACIQLREFEESASILAEVAGLGRQVNEQIVTLGYSTQCGVRALFQEHIDDAETRLLQALQIARMQGETGEIVRILHFLGYAMAFKGAYERGRDYLAEAIALVGPDSYRVGAVASIAMGRLEIRAGRPEAAAPWVARVLRLRYENGDYSLLRIPLIDAAIVLALRGNPELAVRLLGGARANEERGKPRTLFNGPGQETYDALRDQFGRRRFEQVYNEGAATPLADLVATTLEQLERVRSGVAEADARHGLTGRELDVLALIAQGYSNPEIADALSIGTETVKTHARHVLAKLGVPSRSAAVALAVREHLVTPATTPGMSHPVPRADSPSVPASARNG